MVTSAHQGLWCRESLSVWGCFISLLISEIDVTAFSKITCFLAESVSLYMQQDVISEESILVREETGLLTEKSLETD